MTIDFCIPSPSKGKWGTFFRYIRSRTLHFVATVTTVTNWDATHSDYEAWKTLMGEELGHSQSGLKQVKGMLTLNGNPMTDLCMGRHLQCGG